MLAEFVTKKTQNAMRTNKMKTVKDIKLELLSTGFFNSNEISHLEDNKYKSQEYPLIIFISDEKLYCNNEQCILLGKYADRVKDTPNGRVYCFT